MGKILLYNRPIVSVHKWVPGTANGGATLRLLLNYNRPSSGTETRFGHRASHSLLYCFLGGGVNASAIALVFGIE